MDKNLYKWGVIENIVIIIVTAVLFYITRSAWCFLFLLLINYPKWKE